MSVKLDWEIEDERVKSNGLGENSAAVERRHTAHRRTLLAIGLMILVVVAVFGGIIARLWYVEFEIERQLRETVSAEAAALRIGDIAAFLYVQRSESDAWMLGQTDRFWDYQQLKLNREVQLTGEVLDVLVDENRGRVLVEEIIDGVSYQQAWFYWRYADGWRHVPRDITFWGEDVRHEGENFAVEYADLDMPLAEALIAALERLWGEGCRWLACATPPPFLTVQVMPDPSVGVSWSPDDADVLRVVSPLVGRSLTEVALPPSTAQTAGALLADRLVDHARGGFEPVPGTDAAFLEKALQDWLTGRFLNGASGPGSTFIESLVLAYGERAVGLLVHAIRPASGIDLVAAVYETPLEQLPVDWREFLQWRLALEPYFAGLGDAAEVLALYDDRAQGEAQALLADPNAAARPVPTVLRAVIGAGADGLPRAWAIVQYPDSSEGAITFRQVDGLWRRSVADPTYVNYDVP